eukprot:scpid61355/ scgid19533/ 
MATLGEAWGSPAFQDLKPILILCMSSTRLAGLAHGKGLLSEQQCETIGSLSGRVKRNTQLLEFLEKGSSATDFHTFMVLVMQHAPEDVTRRVDRRLREAHPAPPKVVGNPWQSDEFVARDYRERILELAPVPLTRAAVKRGLLTADMVAIAQRSEMQSELLRTRRPAKFHNGRVLDTLKKSADTFRPFLDVLDELGQIRLRVELALLLIEEIPSVGADCIISPELGGQVVDAGTAHLEFPDRAVSCVVKVQVEPGFIEKNVLMTSEGGPVRIITVVCCRPHGLKLEKEAELIIYLYSSPTNHTLHVLEVDHSMESSDAEQKGLVQARLTDITNMCTYGEHIACRISRLADFVVVATPNDVELPCAAALRPLLAGRMLHRPMLYVFFRWTSEGGEPTTGELCLVFGPRDRLRFLEFEGMQSLGEWDSLLLNGGMVAKMRVQLPQGCGVAWDASQRDTELEYRLDPDGLLKVASMRLNVAVTHTSSDDAATAASTAEAETAAADPTPGSIEANVHILSYDGDGEVVANILKEFSIPEPGPDHLDYDPWQQAAFSDTDCGGHRDWILGLDSEWLRSAAERVHLLRRDTVLALSELDRVRGSREHNTMLLSIVMRGGTESFKKFLAAIAPHASWQRSFRRFLQHGDSDKEIEDEDEEALRWHGAVLP